MLSFDQKLVMALVLLFAMIVFMIVVGNGTWTGVIFGIVGLVAFLFVAFGL